MARGKISLLSGIFLLLLAGCGCMMRVGPKIVPRDRFDYGAAISSSWKAQMVTNLAKFRYMDPPTFFDVQQVVATYTLEGTATLNTPDWNGAHYYPPASIGGRWNENPTITYSPMTGKKFTQSLLTPISPASIFDLVIAGWPIDAIFAVAVKSINGLHAASLNRLDRSAGDADFYRVLEMLRELQATDEFSIRIGSANTNNSKDGDNKDQDSNDGDNTAQDSNDDNQDSNDNGGSTPSQLILELKRRNPTPEAIAKAQEVRKLLGLDQKTQEFNVAFGAVQTSDKEIAMVTRSILEIIGEASMGVDIPDSDLKENRAVPAPVLPAAAQHVPLFRVHVRSSNSKPNTNDAFVATQYHGHWFWIDDRDLTSKRGLSFLLVLSSLAESGTAPAPPLLTITKP